MIYSIKIESKHGLAQLFHMKACGMGNDSYELADSDYDNRLITCEDAVEHINNK